MKSIPKRNFPGSARRRVIATAFALALLPLAALTSGPVLAQTVASIKQQGVLKVGVQVAQVPWGYTDGAGKLAGFEIDMVNLLGKDLGVKIAFVPVTPANRIAALLTGQVDTVAAVMGIYPDRQKVILFSRPYCNVDTIFIGKTGDTIKGWNDIKKYRVGVPRGTPQDIAVTKAAPGTAIQRFDDDAMNIQALMSGQVDVIGASSTQLVNIAQVAGPGKYDNKFVLARQFNAFGVRPGEREWADYLSGFVARKLASGELNALYKKAVGVDMVELPTTGEGEKALPIIMTKY